MKRYFPSVPLLVLLSIGFVDLVLTAVLHAQGLIVELNPVMRPIIETSEWLFAFVKGATLAAAYLVIMKYMDRHKAYIDKVATIGWIAYVGTWTVWFLRGA